MTIPATKANYKDEINKNFKPYDSDADPGVTVSSIIASWKVCGTLHGNCKLHRGAGGVIISQQNKNRSVIGSYLSGIVVASREKDNAGKPGFSCALLSC